MSVLAPVVSAAHRRRTRRADRQRLVFRLPEAVDIARLVVSAGGNTPMAIDHLARWAPAPIGPAFTEAARHVRLGGTVPEALERAARLLGPPAVPLVRAFVAAERYGVAVGPLLERVRHQAEAARALAVEASVRRIPVLALFPLTTCILPAFVLLTVVPLLAGALAGIGGTSVP